MQPESIAHGVPLPPCTWHAMVEKVVEARDRRSIVVSTPTSMKSFMLKLVELLHKLDIGRQERLDLREDDDIGAAGRVR